MKTKNIFALAAATLMGFYACSNEEVTPNNFPEDNVIRFNVQVDDGHSRGTHTTASTIPSFGIFKFDNNKKYEYINIEVNNKNGQWIPAKQMLWKNSTEAVTMIVYTPYKGPENSYAGLEDKEVKAVQTADDYSSDILFCRFDYFIPNQDLVNGKVNIVFKHMRSLMDINFTLGTEFNATSPLAANPIQTVKLNGTSLREDPNGNAPKPEFIAPITTYNTAFTAATSLTTFAKATYRCICVPQTATLTVEVTLTDGRKFTWTGASETLLENGKKYSLPLKLGKDLVLMNEISATPWDTTTETDTPVETE